MFRRWLVGDAYRPLFQDLQRRLPDGRGPLANDRVRTGGGSRSHI